MTVPLTKTASVKEQAGALSLDKFFGVDARLIYS